MYSLTQATQLFIKHSEIGNKNVNKDVQAYNAHKIRHSLGVLETGRNLLIKIKENQTISSEIQNKAEIVFFLHDLGRFYQNDGERILTNSEFDHGDASCKLAQEAGYSEDICLAIKYHNKYSIDLLFLEPSYIAMSEEDKNTTIFLAKLARDADKLQTMIFTIFDVDGLCRMTTDRRNGDISDEIFPDLEAKRTIDRKLMKTSVDDVIGVVGWFFDIYFQESIGMLKYYGYLTKIFDTVEKMPGVSKSKVERLRQIFKDFL